MSGSAPSRSRWRDESGLDRPHRDREAGREPGRVAPLARSAHASGGRVLRLNAGPLQRPRFSIHNKEPPTAIFLPQAPWSPHAVRPVCGRAHRVRSALSLRNQGARQATPIDMPLGAARPVRIPGCVQWTGNRPGPDLVSGQSISLQLVHWQLTSATSAPRRPTHLPRCPCSARQDQALSFAGERPSPRRSRTAAGHGRWDMHDAALAMDPDEIRHQLNEPEKERPVLCILGQY